MQNTLCTGLYSLFYIGHSVIWLKDLWKNRKSSSKQNLDLPLVVKMWVRIATSKGYNFAICEQQLTLLRNAKNCKLISELSQKV